MGDLIYRADLIEQPFKNVRGRQHRRDPRDKQYCKCEVLERKISLKEQRQEKTDREVEQDAEKRKKDCVYNRSPENRVGNGGLVLREPVERHVSADKGVDRGLPKAQRQTVHDRVKQQHQAENDEGQNEQVRRGVETGLSWHQSRSVRDY